MLLDIFSGFDDHNLVLFNWFVVVWVAIMIFCVGMFNFYWLGYGYYYSFVSMFLATVDDLVVRTKANFLGGASALFSSLLVLLVALNLLGLAPYVFSVTSHLAINLSLALPIWVSIVLMSVTSDLPSFIAHLQPVGAPAPLNPFLCVIELVSLAVRPITLSVRLTANLSTGHILMGLLGVGFAGSQLWVGVMILFVGSFYFMFEMAVCFIQGYIFTLLPTLYVDEHPSSEDH